MFYKELTDWELSSSYPFVPLLGVNVETGCALSSITPPVPAKVPGSVYRDLLNAGIIEDPFYEMNSLKCEWVANRWWYYATEVEAPVSRPAGTIHLVFEGVDYRVRVFLNGELLGEHEGMNIPVEYDVTDRLRYGEKNLVGVMVENAPEEQAQIRTSLSESIQAIIAQTLFKRADKKGRVPALEIMFGIPSVRNMIRESKTFQLPSVLQTNRNVGMQTMDDDIERLLLQRIIAPEAALVHAQDKGRLREAIGKLK